VRIAPDRTPQEESRWRRLSDIVTSGRRCRLCRRYGTPQNPICVHHVWPRSFGGPDELDNLIPVCRRCHPRAERDSRKQVAAEDTKVARWKQGQARARARDVLLQRALERDAGRAALLE
jgi:5-methylcytosine-specific restriction endonuclease McrA